MQIQRWLLDEAANEERRRTRHAGIGNIEIALRVQKKSDEGAARQPDRMVPYESRV